MREVSAVDINYKKIISSRTLRIKIMQTLFGAFFFDFGIVLIPLYLGQLTNIPTIL